MGWPRKNEVARLYKEKKEGAYLMIFPDQINFRGNYDAIANVYPGSSPSLVGTSIGRAWFADTWPKRVAWDELPPEWREAFTRYMTAGGDEFDPASMPGLWRKVAAK